MSSIWLKSDDLNPCPLCGNPDVEYRSPPDPFMDERHHEGVRCNACKLTLIAYDGERAKDRWNRRERDTLAEQVRELRQCIMRAEEIANGADTTGNENELIQPLVEHLVRLSACQRGRTTTGRPSIWPAGASPRPKP